MNTLNINIFYLVAIVAISLSSCTREHKTDMTTPEWQNRLDNALPLLGHRNWILVVDKAFPLQNGEGFEVIYAKDKLLPVLKIVLSKLKEADHVKPFFYIDKELDYLTPQLAPNVDQLKDSLFQVLGSQPNKILHDSVFVKLDEASKLFKILVIKTDELIPYTSVFINLDCRYWSDEREAALRKIMEQ